MDYWFVKSFPLGGNQKLITNGFENLREQIQNLLNGDEKLDERFNSFVMESRG